MSGLLDRWNSLDAGEKERRLRECSADAGADHSLHTSLVEPAAVCEASDAQRAQYFLEQQAGGGASPYRIPLALELDGDYDPRALVEAVRQTVDDLPVLRSALRADTHGAVESFLLSEADVHTLVTAERITASDVAQRLDELAGEPQRTSDPGLFRATLLTVDGGVDTLLLCGHHAITDGLSMAIIVDHIADRYRTLRDSSAGRATKAPTTSYRSLIPLMTQRHQDAVDGGAVQWWRTQLSGAVPGRFAPDTCDTSATPRTAAGHLQTHISAGAWSRLRQQAQAHGAGDASAVLALVSTVLARHMVAGQDFVVGLSTAGRAVTSEMTCVGPFADTVPVRVNATQDASVDGLLQSLSAAPAVGTVHELPFSRLVAEMAPERRTGRNPLYDVLVTMDPLPAEKQHVDQSLSWTVRPVLNHTARLPFQVTGKPESDGGLAVRIDYALRDYTHAYAAQLAAEIVEAAEGPVSSAESTNVVAGNNDSSSVVMTALSVVQRFQDRVQDGPDQIAIDHDDLRLTYRQVDQLSDAFAADLVSRTDAGDRVADVTGVAAATPITMLALFKAGLVYVPMASDQPRERQSMMLQDAAVGLVLQTSITSDTLHAEYRSTDGEFTASSDLRTAALHTASGVVPRPHPVAYVIFTSGSTGRPKGVEVSHQALGTFVAAMGSAGHVRAGEAVLAITSTTFDISLDELLLPLTVGARIVIGPRAIAAGAASASALINTGAVDVVHATPSVCQLLITTGWTKVVRRVLVGGEALTRQMALLLCERGEQVINLYGPTEATVWAFSAPVSPDHLYDDRGPTIGRPLPGYHGLVVDENLAPVPAGVPGELCLGGPALAEGYLGKPELTAEQFVHTPRGRLYRTGDLARMRCDGVVEYLGRRDAQIKLRGHRIELGDIEAAAKTLPGVVDCAAALVADSLALLVVGDADSQLRAQLTGKLPPAMVPTHLHHCGALPMTPNGKLDRRAVTATLQELVESTANATQPHHGTELSHGSLPLTPNAAPPAPLTTYESWIVELWSGLLNRPVGRWDNVFEVGGHSLMLARTAAQARDDLHLEISLEAMFADPTPHGVGLLMAQAEDELQDVLAMVSTLDATQVEELLKSS